MAKESTKHDVKQGDINRESHEKVIRTVAKKLQGRRKLETQLHSHKRVETDSAQRTVTCRKAFILWRIGPPRKASNGDGKVSLHHALRQLQVRQNGETMLLNTSDKLRALSALDHLGFETEASRARAKANVNAGPSTQSITLARVTGRRKHSRAAAMSGRWFCTKKIEACMLIASWRSTESEKPPSYIVLHSP